MRSFMTMLLALALYMGPSLSIANVLNEVKPLPAAIDDMALESLPNANLELALAEVLKVMPQLLSELRPSDLCNSLECSSGPELEERQVVSLEELKRVEPACAKKILEDIEESRSGVLKNSSNLTPLSITTQMFSTGLAQKDLVFLIDLLTTDSPFKTPIHGGEPAFISSYVGLLELWALLGLNEIKNEMLKQELLKQQRILAIFKEELESVHNNCKKSYPMELIIAKLNRSIQKAYGDQQSFKEGLRYIRYYAASATATAAISAASLSAAATLGEAATTQIVPSNVILLKSLVALGTVIPPLIAATGAVKIVQHGHTISKCSAKKRWGRDKIDEIIALETTVNDSDIKEILQMKKRSIDNQFTHNRITQAISGIGVASGVFDVAGGSLLGGAMMAGVATTGTAVTVLTIVGSGGIVLGVALITGGTAYAIYKNRHNIANSGRRLSDFFKDKSYNVQLYYYDKQNLKLATEFSKLYGGENQIIANVTPVQEKMRELTQRMEGLDPISREFMVLRKEKLRLATDAMTITDSLKDAQRSKSGVEQERAHLQAVAIERRASLEMENGANRFKGVDVQQLVDFKIRISEKLKDPEGMQQIYQFLSENYTDFNSILFRANPLEMVMEYIMEQPPSEYGRIALPR
ncbi:MAG: hypothetical protein HQK50_15270 [Oligoflexia bacterium]|nr:hypothetical protein [Oligoflexia bacterium]